MQDRSGVIFRYAPASASQLLYESVHTHAYQPKRYQSGQANEHRQPEEEEEHNFVELLRVYRERHGSLRGLPNCLIISIWTLLFGLSDMCVASLPHKPGTQSLPVVY
jgi:hypothetical protein